MQRVIYSVLLAVAVSACSSKPVNTDPFPIDAATAADVTLYAEVNGVTLTMQNISTPKPDTQFENQAVNAVELRSILKQDGVVMSDTTGISYFQIAPFKYLAHVEADEYEVVVKQTQLPQTAMIGESGQINKSVTYADDSKAVTVGDSIRSWSLSAANDDSAWLCEALEVYYLAADTNEVRGQFCSEIDTQGAILDYKVIIELSDNKEGSVVFTTL